MRVEQLSRSHWDDALQAGEFSAFHTADALDVLDRHCEGTLYRYGVFDDELVGLVPAFQRDRSLGTAILSPPPGFGVPWLGLVLTDAGTADEAAGDGLASAVVEAVDADTPLTQFRMVCPPDFRDPRPFEWSGLTISPSFADRLDLDDRSPDELRASLVADHRSELRAADASGAEVRTEGLDGTRDCYEAVTSGDATRRLTWTYVRDLVESLGERARTYVSRDEDGTFLAGRVVLYGKTTACSWLPGTADGAPAWTTSHLDWHVVRDAITNPPTETVSTLDLLPMAGNQRCATSKFDAELVPYYEIESAGRYVDELATDQQLTH